MKYFSFFFFITLFFLAACAGPINKELEYYDDGTLRFEVPLLNGKRNGYAYEYYRSKKIKARAFYRENVAIDTQEFFLETGELMQRIFLNKHGVQTDFFRFKKNGERDHSYMFPIFYLVNDTLQKAQMMLGDTARFFVRLGNADTTVYNKGSLVISKDRHLGDTLLMIDSDNKKGFEYKFKPTKPGLHIIQGALIFAFKKKNKIKKFSFEYKVDVLKEI